MPYQVHSSPTTSLRAVPALGTVAPVSPRFSRSHLLISLLNPFAEKLPRSCPSLAQTMLRPQSPEFRPAAPSTSRGPWKAAPGSALGLSPPRLPLRRGPIGPHPILGRTKSSHLHKETASPTAPAAQPVASPDAPTRIVPGLQRVQNSQPRVGRHRSAQPSDQSVMRFPAARSRFGLPLRPARSASRHKFRSRRHATPRQFDPDVAPPPRPPRYCRSTPASIPNE